MFPALDIAGTIRRELAACTGHFVPPPGAKPIAWSAFVDILGTTTGVAMGVYWEPRTCSALNALSNAFRIAADTPEPGEAFQQGALGVVWPSVVVSRDPTEVAINTIPQTELRQSWLLNGQPISGYQKQLTGGNYSASYTAGGAQPLSSSGTGDIQTAPLAGIQLRAADRLVCVITPQAGLNASAKYRAVAMVRGWQWTPAVKG